MGAEFVYLDFEEEQQDGAATGGYASVQSEEFRNAQLAKFRELAPEMDIVITTALIPNRPAPKLWLERHDRGDEARFGPLLTLLPSVAATPKAPLPTKRSSPRTA